MGSSPVRSRIAIRMKAMVRGAPRRATEAATRTAPAGTNRSRLQRTTLPSSKSRPTPQPMLTYVTKSSHQASPAVTHQAPDKAPNRHARTARALSTPPSFARLPSLRTQLRQVVQGCRRAKGSLCTWARVLQVERQATTGREEVISEERSILAGSQVLEGQSRKERRRRRGRRWLMHRLRGQQRQQHVSRPPS